MSRGRLHRSLPVPALLAALAVAGVAAAQPAPDPGSGSAADPGAGSAMGSGSAGSGAGSAAVGAGSGSAAGSGSGTGPRVIQLPTDASAPQVSAAASPTEVRLGAKFTLFITATFVDGVEVNLREPLELGSGFEVTRKVSENRPAGDGRTTREWQVEVIAWELGDLVMPPVAVTYTAFGRADQVATNRVKLRVIGVLGDVVDDPKAMRGNAEPRALLARDWFWLYVAIGGTLVLGVLVTIFLLWRNSRRKHVVLVGGVYRASRKFDTPSSRALEKLLAIEASGVLERDDDRKQGYADMVDVIREYLGSRYRVATYDLTSSELLRRLEKLAPLGERELIESWLDDCDIVKYGGFKATAEDAKQTLDDGRTLIITTTQSASPPSVAAPAGGSPADGDRPPSGPSEPTPPEPDNSKEAA